MSTAFMSDSAILKKLVEGDHKALERIYDRYSPALLGIIMRIVKSEDIAKEVLQESFIKIWKNAKSYDESKGRFFTWASRIAKNTALNYINLKSEKKQSQTKELEQKHHDLRIQNPNIDVLDIRAKVNELDEKYKLIVNLLYFQGYTQQEISDEYNIPIGTVKTRVRSAIQQLRRIYDDSILHTKESSHILIALLCIILLP